MAAQSAADQQRFAARVQWTRRAGNFLRKTFPWLGTRLDKGLRDAIEQWSGPRGKLFLLAGADPNFECFPNIPAASRCARIGNAELIAWICASGGNPASCNAENWGPIHHAAAKGHVASIHMLSRWGASLRQRANNGWTPLMVACRENRIESIIELCAMGVEVDEPDERGEPPLLLCSRRGFDEAVKALLKAGARVNLTERRGFQAIHLAAQQGHDAICLMLLDAGADPEAAGPWNKTPSGLAKAEGRASTFALLERAALSRLNCTLAPPTPKQAKRL